MQLEGQIHLVHLVGRGLVVLAVDGGGGGWHLGINVVNVRLGCLRLMTPIPPSLLVCRWHAKTDGLHEQHDHDSLTTCATTNGLQDLMTSPDLQELATSENEKAMSTLAVSCQLLMRLWQLN